MKKILSKIKTTLSLILSWMLFFFSYLIPRSSKIVVFNGWHSNFEREIFADNSKYFFLYLSHNRPDIKTVWIGMEKKLPLILQKQGYKSYSISSAKGIYYSLRAKYTITDAFMKLSHWRYSGGSKVIQLWHGKGMKKTGHDSPYSLQRYNKFLFPNLFQKYHGLISSSNYTAQLMSRIFQIPREKIVATGLPRNDIFFGPIPGSEIDENKSLQKAIQEAKQSCSKKIILYAPTFRPDGSFPVQQLNLDKLEEFLKNQNMHFIISLHPKFARKDIPKSLVSYHHITFVDSGYDSYSLLPSIDILITDYSSLYIDFLLLDKPLIFFVYDLEKYKKEMGLYEDFEDLTPGPHPKSFEKLLEVLKEQTDTYKKERDRVKKVLFQYPSGNASERIMKAFFK